MLVAINSYSAKNKDEQLVANITIAAVLSDIYRNKAAQQTNIVVDLEGFLKQSISVSDTLESLASQIQTSERQVQSSQRQVQRIKYIEDYTNSYKSRIKQASEALDELKSDIEANNVEMNENIDKVIAEIGELKKKNDANKDALVRKKGELQESLAKQKTFGILKIVTSVITTIATCVVAAVAPPAAPFIPAVGQLAGMGWDGTLWPEIFPSYPLIHRIKYGQTLLLATLVGPNNAANTRIVEK